MSKKHLLGFVALAAMVTLLGGCAGRGPVPEQTSKLRVKVLIDGADSISIQGGKLWAKHHAFQFPGKFNGMDEPIVVNDEEWYPEWTGSQSDVFTNMSAFLPKKPVEVALTVQRGFGDVHVWQQPNEENDFTLVVSLDDRTVAGSEWYVFDLDW